jgi:hypothetical protein
MLFAFYFAFPISQRTCKPQTPEGASPYYQGKDFFCNAGGVEPPYGLKPYIVFYLPNL